MQGALIGSRARGGGGNLPPHTLLSKGASPPFDGEIDTGCRYALRLGATSRTHQTMSCQLHRLVQLARHGAACREEGCGVVDTDVLHTIRTRTGVNVLERPDLRK